MTTASNPRTVQGSPLGVDLDVAYRQQAALDLADRQRLVKALREERLRGRGAQRWLRWQVTVPTSHGHHRPAAR